MKSNSVVSPGLFRSSLRRFWPLWFVGLVGMVLLFDVPVYGAASQIARSGDTFQEQLGSMEDMWLIMQLLPWAYALVGSITVALALHEHLFDARSATFVGSLPVRRPVVFASVALAGLAVLLAIPAVAVLLLIPLRVAVGEIVSFGAAGKWFLLAAFFTLVLYATALVSCQLAGSRPVALLLYMVINFLVVCLEAAVQLLVESLVYGMGALGSPVDWMSPAAWLSTIATNDLVLGAASAPAITLPIACYALAAVAGMVFACWLFCRRDLESAGDSVAFAPLRPVLKYLAAVSTALLFASVFRLTRGWDDFSTPLLQGGEAVSVALFMALGGFLGALFSEMIMRRSARVLEHCWKAGLTVAVASLAFVGACRFDVTGAGRYVPSPDEVQSVEITGNWSNSFTLSDPENVEAACGLQHDIISHGGGHEQSHSTFNIGIVYFLKNGRTVRRVYPVAADWLDADSLSVDSSDEGTRLVARYAELADSPEGRASRFANILDGDSSKMTFELQYRAGDGADYMTTLTMTGDEGASLLEALGHDLLEESAGAVFNQYRWDDGYDASLDIEQTDNGGFVVLHTMQLRDDSCPYTVAWLKEHHPEIELQTWSEQR